MSKSYTVDDAGGNRCGCEGEVVTCVVISSMLQPPTLRD
jgi:hypothetical protein